MNPTKTGVISGAPEGYTDPATHVASVMLLMYVQISCYNTDKIKKLEDLDFKGGNLSCIISSYNGHASVSHCQVENL